MATAFGPERPSAYSPFDPQQDHCLVATMGDMSNSLSLGPEPSPRADLPPPNPHFVFPAQPLSPALDSTPRTNTRRPMSAIETPSSSFGLLPETSDRPGRNALPAFSFNPGASLPQESGSSFLLSPPVSPNATTPRSLGTPSRPPKHGHRRGGSEFVGGRLREGNSIAVMSTSPTKSESGFMTPTLQPPRRGHRRGISGAISTNDLPILQPPPIFDGSVNRGSSAPTSPTGFQRAETAASLPPVDMVVVPDLEPAPKQDDTHHIPEATVSSTQSSPKEGKPANRARVGFSDTLEFIPRPLSLVSNETSSTVTARPGHSLSGSISSIVSAASPSGRESPAPPTKTISREGTESRPSTAGAILERTHESPFANSSPKRRNSIPTLLQFAEAGLVPPSEPSPTKVSKRWSFFARDPSTASSSPTKPRPSSSSSNEDGPKATPCSEHGSDTAGESSGPPAAKTSKKAKKSKKKKNKKAKAWAGQILPRKPKGEGKRSKPEAARPPTPPPSSSAAAEDEDDAIEMLDEPEILDTSTPTVTVTESPDLPSEETASGRHLEESAYPMIDLDAALGPFNTPLPLNPEWEAAQRAAGNVGRRRLHSAQGMKGFSGPGMHYHRRAESAPDLPPFDPGRAGIQRYNSSSTMADVFEEDEEEEAASRLKQAAQDSSGTESDSDATPPAAAAKDPMLDVQDKLSVHSLTQSVRRTTSSLSDKEQTPAGSVRAERSKSSLHDSVIVEEMPSVIFRTPNSIFTDRVGTPDSATLAARNPTGPKDVEISPIHLPTPTNLTHSPYAMSHSSSFPSPRSPMSMDVQRISTASSSVGDENNFQSLLLMGEPGPEVRISMDYDIPSLTSSNSTMTRDSMFIPGHRMSQPSMREPRPVSVSSAAFGRRRSSLASLSRLINSSHGERSKLSTEVTLDSEPATKKPKTSRTKRLSRMMQFWKPNQKESTSTRAE